MYTRREFGALTAMAVGARALPERLTAQIDSTVGGVRIGVQTYSFRALPRTPGSDQSDAIIRAMTRCRISNLHLKDRRRDQGANVPWGTGDTPIHEVLQLLQREGWPIRVHLEYEYRGAGSPVDEVTRCYDYVKQALV